MRANRPCYFRSFKIIQFLLHVRKNIRFGSADVGARIKNILSLCLNGRDKTNLLVL